MSAIGVLCFFLGTSYERHAREALVSRPPFAVSAACTTSEVVVWTITTHARSETRNTASLPFPIRRIFTVPSPQQLSQQKQKQRKRRRFFFKG
mmetsp:Transcript_7611/g.14124  ORF Transcript_7611/g.14124 Transcript_7611/m.14124 type:complete len:93 (-) Transcript_7611:120-398(-)